MSKTTKERRGRRAISVLVLALPALLVASERCAFAHDIWLSPEISGDGLVVRQLVGAELEVGRGLPLLRRITPQYQLVTAAGSIDLLAELPDLKTRPVVQPVLERTVDFEGLALVAMEHAFVHTELPREKFLEYLRHEELELETFRARMREAPTQRERYARTLKCLLQVGDPAQGDLHQRVLGQEIEILLLQNPFLLEAGDDLDVQVLFEGEPLVDHLVTALTGAGGRQISTTKVRTDSDGTARFRLESKGLWLIRLVHLLPNSDDPDVDWDSHWASYTFRLE
jgi:uncharacterized GH25 family protein